MSAAQIPVGFILTLSTEHFEFEAYGITEEQASKALRATLAKHGKQCGLPRNWSDFYLDSVHTREFLPGFGRRDGSIL